MGMAGSLVKVLLDDQDIPLSPGHLIHRLFVQRLEGLRSTLGKLLETDWRKRMEMRDASVLFDAHMRRRTLSPTRPVPKAKKAPRGNSPSLHQLERTSPRLPRSPPPSVRALASSGQSTLKVGQQIYYYARHGKYYTGYTCQRLPDSGWLISLDAQDARGRTPVSKVVPHSEMWRIKVGSDGLDSVPMPSMTRMPSSEKFPSMSKIDTCVAPASGILSPATASRGPAVNSSRGPLQRALISA